MLHVPLTPHHATWPAPLDSRLAALSPGGFRTLLLSLGAVASLMAAEGVQTFARIAEGRVMMGARFQATSPLPYRASVPALHALAPAAAPGEIRILVRADSGQDATVCDIAARRMAQVRWIALSSAPEPCAAREAGPHLLRADSAGAREMGDARWVVLDGQGAVLYSRRTLPAPEGMAGFAALLAPRTEAAR